MQHDPNATLLVLLDLQKMIASAQGRELSQHLAAQSIGQYRRSHFPFPDRVLLYARSVTWELCSVPTGTLVRSIRSIFGNSANIAQSEWEGKRPSCRNPDHLRSPKEE